MRLAAIEKMGYYPTPACVIDAIAPWVSRPEGNWRLLDPCCGKGEAARRLFDHLNNDSPEGVESNGEVWGVELSPGRAREAAQILDRTHNASWQSVRVTNETISVLLLNPPYDYDYDGDDRRLEIEFLRTSVKALAQGGILIYIVPQQLLKYQGAARLLAGHFDNLVIRRFPDGEFERFNQVVVFGQRKEWATPTTEQMDAIRDHKLPSPLASTPDAISWPMEAPAVPKRNRFRRIDIGKREQVALAHNLGWPTELLDAMRPRQRAAFRPVWPLKKGHVAMLMASGLMGTMRIQKKDGCPVLIKGRVIKKVDESTHEDERGNVVCVQRDRFETTVGMIDADGVRVLTNVDELERFMEDYGDLVAEEILRNRPLYDLNPPAEAWRHLSSLSKEREPLPGQAEPGLLEQQKHAAIAMARSCQEQGHALMQGEMGVGKTTVALATIDLMDAYPAVVICPPHLVRKWRREAREVIPGVRTRELKRIGKTASMDHGVNDPERFIEDWRAGRLGNKAIAVMASTSAKLGSGWDGAVTKRHTLPKKDKDRKVFRAALQLYKEHKAALREAREAGSDESTLEDLRQSVAAARRKALEAAIAYPVCPHCGQIQVDVKAGEEVPIRSFKPFERKPRFCDRPTSGWAHDDEGRRIVDEETGKPIWIWNPESDYAPRCGSALHRFGGPNHLRRWPIADYIFGKAKGFFRMLVADEVHHYKSKSSDRGIAFHRLVESTRYQIVLTGTVYGGKASSVFPLMHRLNMGGTQQDFAFGDMRRWVRLYGVLETRIYGGKSRSPDDFGAFNATKRRRARTQEKPGVSPAILTRMIGSSIFLSLKDLGIDLPPYREEVAIIKMDSSQARQYRGMENTLRLRARQHNAYWSTWLQWSLGRPNSCFRDEQVKKRWYDEDGEVENVELLYELPAICDIQLSPKERWLVDFVRSEAQQGRRVIVYARQTGTRDIQPQLLQILTDAGLRAEVLTSSVSTRKREKWLEKHAASMDALISNPRLVETGLDLVQFATVVFYEISYSLYTMWQATRRVWRLRQKRPVKIMYTAYADSLEAQALALMGKKMKAAQLLYGDDVGGAIVPQEDDNFLTQLARTVLDGRELPDLQTLFADRKQETISAMGSPTATSPRLPTYTAEALRTMYLDALHNGDLPGRRRRRRKVPQGQLTLI